MAAVALRDVGGRTFHKDKASAYLLPNDSPEHARLEHQHKCFEIMLQNKLSRAPVSKPSQILDIGCGTGCMTSWFAETFPAATVTGLDLSPVPKLREQQVNVRYLQGNVLQQSPRDWISEDGDRPVLAERGVFDLVFSRLLVAGIKDWEGYIAKQFSLVKPGGWAECQELVMVMYDSQDQATEVWDVYKDNKGVNVLDEMCGQKIKGWMLAAGFEKVESEVISIPVGGQGQRTQQLREVGEFFSRDLLDVIEVAARRGVVDRTPEEVEAVLEKTRAAFAKANGWHMAFYVTYGRKPE